MNSRSSNAQRTTTNTRSSVNTANIANSDGAIVAGEGASITVTDGGAIQAFERLGSEFLSEANTMYQNTLTFADAGLNESIGMAKDVLSDVNQAYREGLASNQALATQITRTPGENQTEMLFKFLIIGSVVLGVAFMFGGNR